MKKSCTAFKHNLPSSYISLLYSIEKDFIFLLMLKVTSYVDENSLISDLYLSSIFS